MGIRDHSSPSRIQHPDNLPKTYLVELDDRKHAMSLDRDAYDHNPEIGFMTYGHPVFDELLRRGSDQ